MFVDEGFPRPEPHVTDQTTAYWRGGTDGALRITRCAACGHYTHPPLPVCPRCRSREVAPQPVSGRGQVWAWTISRYQWSPTIEPPYVIAEIELIEQARLRVLSSVIGCGIDDVRAGMEVEVCFASSGNTFIPLFRPLAL
ncbi:MAG: Zn-ribbon domain-containing OB-fold protein [Acidimicrobiales bacterium]